MARDTYKKYGHRIQQYLRRTLRSPEEIDDVSQDLLEALLKQDSGEQHVTNPLAYIYGMAARLSYDSRKRHRMASERFVDIESLRASSELIPKLHQADSSEQLNLQRQLEHAFAQLPPMHARVFLCIKRDGLSYEQTAALLGIKKSRVERYFINARSRLRTMAWDR
jgi:RNA polymerase sigma factor (sigma-70 family)